MFVVFGVDFVGGVVVVLWVLWWFEFGVVVGGVVLVDVGWVFDGCVFVWLCMWFVFVCRCFVVLGLWVFGFEGVVGFGLWWVLFVVYGMFGVLLCFFFELFLMFGLFGLGFGECWVWFGYVFVV